MDTVIFPELIRVVFQESGNKNIIKQLIAKEISVPIGTVEVSNNAIIIRHEGKKYYLTSNKNDIPVDKEYVLLTNAKPSKNKLISKEVYIKKWQKHPDLKAHSPNEVIESWKNDFSFKEEDPTQSVKGLRDPQIGALYTILGHLKMPLESAIVVLPTGTGKTETMLSALIANQCSKLLITVPSDSLRKQISNKFSTLGLLKQFGIVGDKSLYPIVGIIKNRFTTLSDLNDFIARCNVVVTTMSILTGCSNEEQEKIASLCSHIFIDEAHHVKAASWNEFKNKFQKEKVIQFTATPFRNDGKRLDGKIIFNFPLRKAQEQGYFTKIDFIAVREYDIEKADKLIAETAVSKLKEDIEKGYNHLLMARCATKERARKIFELYKDYTDLNPVIVFSGSADFRETYEKILNKEAKIIVCVDMLGEGFDLPELKVAAFHDIRKSLPITLQLAGRFTRTKYDEQLGSASFVANIADLNVKAELAELYSRDADWNQILSDSSSDRVDDEVKFKDFLSGFSKLHDSNIPFQNIRPKLSTVVYKNKSTTWFPTNFSKGIEGYDDLEFKFADVNSEEKFLVIITARKQDVEWINNKEIYQIQWDITIVFWETKNNLLFINSSDNSSLYLELAQSIIGENAELIKGINVFKTFHNIQRVKLQNVGLRQFLGKNITFRMMVGSDIEEALSIAEKQRGEKAFVMGVGFEDGRPVNIGTSYKGRIWTKLVGDLKQFKKWCIGVGNKLANDSIDPNQILKETLMPKMVSVIPNMYPVWIDWDVDVYLSAETRFRFVIDGLISDLSNTDLILTNPSAGGDLLFSIVTPDKTVTFKLELYENTSDSPSYPDFRVIQQGSNKVEVLYGSKNITGVNFFQTFIPTIWFADGSALSGNEFVELKQSINIFPKESIIELDWTGIDLSKESQGVSPKIKNSIQYKMIQDLLKEDFDIIYDDDYSGEIADIVAVKLHPDKIAVNFYHLKFAIDGVVSSQIKNFYEVCGQAQKSIHWKHKSGKDFFNHLLRRETKTRTGNYCSRLEKGTIKDLEKFLSIAKNEIPIEFEMYIVQPGFSQAKATEEILTLLGVTENHIKEFAGINLKVVGSK